MKSKALWCSLISAMVVTAGIWVSLRSEGREAGTPPSPVVPAGISGSPSPGETLTQPGREMLGSKRNSPAGPDEITQWVLTGTVKGVTEVKARGALISVTGSHSHPSPPNGGVHAKCSEGAFSADVSELVSGSCSGECELIISGEIPGMPLARTAVAIGAGSLTKPSVLLFVATLDFYQPVARIHGVVIGEDGTGLRAHVGVFRVGGGKRPVVTAEDRCKEDGSFALTVEPVGGEFLAIAYDNYRPHSGQLWLVPGEQAVGTIRLSKGEVISGVVADGTSANGSEGVALTASRLDRTPEALLAWKAGTFLWQDDHLEYTSRRTVTRENGEFMLSGLATAEYMLTTHGEGGSCVVPGTKAGRMIVTAPANGVNLTLPTSHILFQVRHGEVPVGGVAIQVGVDGQHVECFTNEAGERSFEVAVSATCQIEVAKVGYKAQAFSVLAFPAGAREVQVELERDTEETSAQRRGHIVVEMVGAEAASLELAGYALYEAGVDLGEERPRRPIRRASVRSTGGVFRIEDVVSGPYILEVHPGSGWPYCYKSMICSEVHEVDVVSGGEVKVTIEPQVGGQLRLRIKNEENQVVAAQCVISTALQDIVPVGFVYVHEESNTIFFDRRIPHQWLDDPEGFVFVQPALEPGDYWADVSLEGYEEANIKFVIQEDEITYVDIDLIHVE